MVFSAYSLSTASLCDKHVSWSENVLYVLFQLLNPSLEKAVSLFRLNEINFIISAYKAKDSTAYRTIHTLAKNIADMFKM